MKYTAAVILAAGASAQIVPNLPADINSYAASLQTNTPAFEALLGIFTAPGVQAAAAAAPTEALPQAIAGFSSAVAAAIAAEPASLQPIASSIVNAIAPLALTDGLLFGGVRTGAASGSGSAATTMVTATGGASSGVNGTAARTTVGTGATGSAGTGGTGGTAGTAGTATGATPTAPRTSGASVTAATPTGAAAKIGGSAALIAGGLMAVFAL